jgi:hypothetical protein
MKKVISLLLFFVCLIGVYGCNKKVYNDGINSVELIKSESKEDVVKNIKNVLDKVEGFNFSGYLKYKDKIYNISGKVVLGETIGKSIIVINYNSINIYLYNEEIYISYIYKNTNNIIKDGLENFIYEIPYINNKESTIDFIRNKRIKDINYSDITSYLTKEQDGYVIDLKGLKLNVDNRFLINKLIYSNEDFNVELSFTYDAVSINVPIGYSLINLDINQIKKIMKINNIFDLIS